MHQVVARVSVLWKKGHLQEDLSLLKKTNKLTKDESRRKDQYMLDSLKLNQKILSTLIQKPVHFHTMHCNHMNLKICKNCHEVFTSAKSSREVMKDSRNSYEMLNTLKCSSEFLSIKECKLHTAFRKAFLSAT